MAICFQKAILESADPKKELFIFKTPTKNIKGRCEARILQTNLKFRIFFQV